MAIDPPQHSAELALWIEALDKAEEEFNREEKIVAWLYVALWWLPFTLYWLSGAERNWIFYFLLAAGIVSLLIRIREERQAKEQPDEPQVQPELKDQLYASGIAERLVSGALWNDEIREYTPVPLRWMVPTLRKGNRLGLLRRVFASLEWYVGMPRRHVRLSWTSLAAMLGLPTMLLFITITTPQDNIAQALVTPALGFAAMSAFAYMMIPSRRLLLATYLRDAWTDDQTAVSQVTAQAVDESVRMNLVLNQCSQDLEQMTYGLSIAPMMVLMLGSLSLSTLVGHWAFALAFILAMIYPVFWLGTAFKSYRAQLRTMTDESAIALQITSGELIDDDPVLKTVPRALHWLAQFPEPPKAYADELRRVIWRVALNLDWYIEPAAMHIRWSWAAVPALVLLVVVVFVQSITAGIAGDALPPQTLIAVAVLGVILTTIMVLDAGRLRVRVQVLIDHLRARLV